MNEQPQANQVDQWSESQPCTLCRNCRVNRLKEGSARRTQTPPGKLLPCMYLLSLISTPPSPEKFLLDEMTLKKQGRNRERFWKQNLKIPVSQRKRFRKDSSIFLSPAAKERQAHFESLELMKQYNTLSVNIGVRQKHRCATVIANWWRARLAKRVLIEIRRQRELRTEAALVIQRLLRYCLKLLHEEQLRASCCVLQSVWRGRKARQRVWPMYYHVLKKATLGIVAPKKSPLSKVLEACSLFLPPEEMSIAQSCVNLVGGGVSAIYHIDPSSSQVLRAIRLRLSLPRVHAEFFRCKEKRKKKQLKELAKRKRAMELAKMEKERKERDKEMQRLAMLKLREKEEKIQAERQRTLALRREQNHLRSVKEEAREKKRMEREAHERLFRAWQGKLEAAKAALQKEEEMASRNRERLKNDEVRRLQRWKAREEVRKRDEMEEKQYELGIALHGGEHHKRKGVGGDDLLQSTEDESEQTAIDIYTL